MKNGKKLSFIYPIDQCSISKKQTSLYFPIYLSKMAMSLTEEAKHIQVSILFTSVIRKMR